MERNQEYLGKRTIAMEEALTFARLTNPVETIAHVSSSGLPLKDTDENRKVRTNGVGSPQADESSPLIYNRLSC